MENIIIVSGGFDPVHIGHIRYFQDASRLGKVIVALNSDEWLTRKKGKPFMNWNERKTILSEMKSISDVIAFDDGDKHNSVCDAIRKVVDFYSGSGVKIIFAKGGDRTLNNIPEVDVCKELGVEMKFGVGGENKPQSSSWLLKNWKK